MATFEALVRDECDELIEVLSRDIERLIRSQDEVERVAHGSLLLIGVSLAR